MSLLNLSRKVLFTFFPAKALFGWTMLDPPCAPWGDDLPAGRAGAFGLVPRPNIYPNVITYQGTPRMPIAAIASNCVKLYQIVANNMNQHESIWIKKRLWHLLCWGLGHVLMEYWKGACHAVNHAMDVCFSLWMVSPLMWSSPHPIIDNSH